MTSFTAVDVIRVKRDGGTLPDAQIDWVIDAYTRGVVAEEQQSRIGAAWFRLWTPELHSYGFVNAETPELGIAVALGHRSRGVGRTLLRALIEIAQSDGLPALSLSVSPFNYARALYESEGFCKVGESGTSWTLVLRLGL